MGSKSKFICLLLTGVLGFIGLVGVFVVVAQRRSPCLQEVSAAAVLDTTSISTDMANKVAKLPKNDLKNFYIINSLNNEIISFSMELRHDSDVPAGMADMYLLVLVIDKMPFMRFCERDGEVTVLFSNGGSSVADIDIFGTEGMLKENNKYWPYLSACAYTMYNEKKQLSAFYTNSIICRNYIDGFIALGFDIPTLRTETQYVYLEYESKKCNIGFEYIDSTGKWQVYNYQVEEGAALTDFPDTASVPYATFKGWNRPLAPAVDDITYRAVYDYDKFNVVYRNYDGTIFRTEQTDYYTPLTGYSLSERTLIDGTKKKIYKFSGWSTEENSATAMNLASVKVNKDISLYPVYTLDKVIDLETGNTDIDNSPEPQAPLGIWGLIVKGYEFCSKVPVFGGLLKVLYVVAVCGVGIAVLVVVIKLITLVVNAIRGLIPKRNKKSEGGNKK